jgi:ATP-binding cassette, subfamily B, bacterial PglK
MTTLRNLYRLLSPRERKQVLLLVPLLALTALVEVAGIASITPFLAIVADPGAVERHDLLRRAYEFGGFADTRGFLVALGALMFVFILTSNALRALTTWAVLRFSWMRNHTIALRLLRSYLARPYSFFLERHSADLGKNLVTEVQQVVSGTLVPTMQASAKGVAALAILTLLLIVDPGLALLAASTLGGAFALIFIAVRRQQRRVGKERVAANQSRFQVLSEAFGGIKEVKLLGREETFLRRFTRPSHRFAATIANNALVSQLPRFALEALAFGGIVIVVLYLLQAGRPFETILPVLGLFAFAGYRLMPALQYIFMAVTNIRFNAAALDGLLADLPSREQAERRQPPAEPPLPFRESIRLRGVTFQFATAKEPLFENLDLEIQAGTSVAFVGETGSGKSTLADLILGLLTPDQGTIEIDGVPLTDENVRRWQRNIGYVPQMIFLSDESVARNIAFGLADDEIDMEAVVRAAKLACIHDFIVNELPKGYETVVGERGVRLSGGQRQRIGVARALYRDPAVLVLDEATSALDNETEAHILASIRSLADSKTILTIAHRISSIKDAELVLELEGGAIGVRAGRSATFDPVPTHGKPTLRQAGPAATEPLP